MLCAVVMPFDELQQNAKADIFFYSVKQFDFCISATINLVNGKSFAFDAT